MEQGAKDNAAMTISELTADRPIRTRKHRMMRKSEAVRRWREHRRMAGELAIRLDALPFWRWRVRADLADQLTHHEDMARTYGQVCGETGSATAHGGDGRSLP
jgi:hypothetical protein